MNLRERISEELSENKGIMYVLSPHEYIIVESSKNNNNIIITIKIKKIKNEKKKLNI